MTAGADPNWVEITTLIIGGVGSVTGIVGGVTGIVSAWISCLQWRKINKKIAMLQDSGAAFEILPAWYTRRMMDDRWLFGLQTNDGKIIIIRRIKAVSDDAQWMDVELAERDDAERLTEDRGALVFAVAGDRTEASIRISNIVAAYDLDTS